MKPRTLRIISLTFAIAVILAIMPALAERALAEANIKGQVLGAGTPISQSTVTLYAATAEEPRRLAETKTDSEGRFELRSNRVPAESSLYLLVIGSKPPAHVVISEMTTVASVWTHAQFLVGETIKGPTLGLRIAAGNVPNFVNLSSGE